MCIMTGKSGNAKFGGWVSKIEIHITMLFLVLSTRDSLNQIDLLTNKKCTTYWWQIFLLSLIALFSQYPGKRRSKKYDCGTFQT